MGNPGKKQVGFGRERRKRPMMSNAEIRLEDIDRAFGESTMPVKVVPMVSTARNTGVKANVFAWVSINASAVSRSGTRRFAYTNANGRRSIKSERFMTNPLEA